MKKGRDACCTFHQLQSTKIWLNVYARMNFIQEVSELQFSLCSEQIKSAIVSVLQKDENEPQDYRLSTTHSGLTLVVELECKDCSEHREHLQLCTNALPLLPLPVTIM